MSPPPSGFSHIEPDNTGLAEHFLVSKYARSDLLGRPETILSVDDGFTCTAACPIQAGDCDNENHHILAVTIGKFLRPAPDLCATEYLGV